MYRDNGVRTNGYEDAIPIKRSKKSQRIREEGRREADKNRGSVEFSVKRTESASRPMPGKVDLSENKRTIPAVPVTKDTVSPPSRRISSPVKREEAPEVNVVKKTETTAAEVSRRSIPMNQEKKAAHVAMVEKDSKPVKTSSSTYEKPVTGIESETPDNTGRMEGFTSISRAPVNGGADKPEEKKTTRLTAGKVIRRSLLSVFTALFLAVVTVFGACYTIAVGPSETVRNILVLSALQASATKWVPGLFLDDAVVQQILEDSKKVNTDVISVEDYQNSQSEEQGDKWENAIDGMIYEPVSGPTFKGYVLLVKDPARVTVGVATDKFTDATPGLRIFDMAEKYGAVAAINGGEYPDAGGMGIGGRPIGLTYSGGECVWNDGLRRSFMGFDKNNKLVCREGLTKAQADELGIRDGVCFQTGKTLITNEDGNVTLYYADSDTGTAQRTAIGQTADGTVILLVTDGRTASSLGATKNDVIDVMVSYGAISAGMLDGGSSSLMYYKDFYDKYGLDKSGLDEYQRMGLINKYKAFTTPRRLPTCFIVAPE